ncbi:MAG: hypothetical protein JSW05_04100 [Candidatus Thorarchaeota archaeon]|nr:MAG: hypothetical protein JSW05_04100 [Candidatus Thorarchaeota archaeon]
MTPRFVRRRSSRLTFAVRIALGGIFLFLLWLYPYTLTMSGDWTGGVWWQSSPPGSLFPIPRMPGVLMALVAANEVDSLIYLLLYRTGLWLWYSLFAVPFAFSPWTVTSEDQTEVIFDEPLGQKQVRVANSNDLLLEVGG